MHAQIDSQGYLLKKCGYTSVSICASALLNLTTVISLNPHIVH